jgi:hypothetical protein
MHSIERHRDVARGSAADQALRAREIGRARGAASVDGTGAPEVSDHGGPTGDGNGTSTSAS